MIVLALRLTLLLALAGLAAWALQRRSAALRSALWAATLGAALLMPVLPSAEVAVPESRLPSPLAGPRWTFAPSQTTPPETPVGSPQPSSEAYDPAVLLLASYLLGVGVVVGATGLGLCRAARLVTIARPASPAIDAVATRIAAERRLRARPRVALAAEGTPPLVAGPFRSTILLPEEAGGWDEARLERVLRHEMAHVERGDLALLLVGRAACAAYWWHPLVWLAARAMRQEGERAADDVALGGASKASDYAEELLGWSRRPVAPGATLPMSRRSGLSVRLRHVLNARADRRGLGRRASLGLALTALLGAGLLPSVRAQVEEKIVNPVVYATVVSVGPSAFRLPDGSGLRIVGLVGLGPDGKARMWDVFGAPLPLTDPVARRTVRLYARQYPSPGRPYLGVLWALRDARPEPSLQPSSGVAFGSGLSLSYMAALTYRKGEGRYLQMGARPASLVRDDLSFTVATGRYRAVAIEKVGGSGPLSPRRLSEDEAALAVGRFVDEKGPRLWVRWNLPARSDGWEYRQTLRLASGRVVAADQSAWKESRGYTLFRVDPRAVGTLRLERRPQTRLVARGVALAPR